MDIVSNNIANMNTPGYRAQNMVFTEYLAKPDGYRKVQEPLSMVLDYGHYQNTEPGPMRQTGNPLDVAVQGPGWLGVQTQGGVMYTRAGNFQVNLNGELVTGRGDLVAGEGGGTITIPADARDLKVASDGTISTDQGTLGKLMVVEFENEQGLQAMGNGLYKTDAAGQPAANSTVLQGMIEGANVQPVLEMTRMIDVLRSYQNTQRMLQSEHERERGMIQNLSNPRG